MTTRFNSRSVRRFNVSGLESGYGGQGSALVIPPVGLQDVDAALFKLFDDDLRLTVHVSETNKQEIRKVPVMFTSSEKWALAKRQKGLRDKTGSLILPLITVVRTSVKQDPASDINGRGMNQQTGEIVIKRRLDNSDRNYQGLINRYALNNQSNVAVAAVSADPSVLSTTRPIGDLSTSAIGVDGAMLVNNRNRNVYETLVVPSPQFFTATYEVTIWTQYYLQMTEIIDSIMASFLPQGNAWKLDTPKGYWFIATVEGNQYEPDNNFADMSQEERMIKYKFTINVPGYVLATNVPGAPVPVKRYVSTPSITFDVGVDAAVTVEPDTVDDPFLGVDDPTLPLVDTKVRRPDQRADGSTPIYPLDGSSPPHDPARRGRIPNKYKKVRYVGLDGKESTRYVRISSENRHTGETTFRSDSALGGLDYIVIDD